MKQHINRQEQNISKPAMLFLLLTAFFNAMGLTIAFPVLPFAVGQYVKDPNDLALWVGLLSSIYAVCQFVAAPGLGMLSDRYGRRPLLLICLLGSALGYVLFGLGGAVWVLALSRAIDGLTGGNISILAAYIGDMSQKHTRAADFGKVSAWAGVGTLFGPIIGGFTATWGYQIPFFIAAGLTLANLVWGYFFLPESLERERRVTTPIRIRDLNPVQHLRTVLAFTRARWFLLCVFLYYLPFSAFGTVWVVFFKESLSWTPGQISLLITLVGVTDILVQGVVIRRLLPYFGDVRLTVIGLICVLAGYLLFCSLIFAPSLISVLLAIILYAGGGGLVEATLQSLLSEAAGPDHQGIVQGGSQAVQALARIGGSSVGGVLYARAGHISPFGMGAGIVILLFFTLWRAATILHTDQVTRTSAREQDKTTV